MNKIKEQCTESKVNPEISPAAMKAEELSLLMSVREDITENINYNKNDIHRIQQDIDKDDRKLKTVSRLIQRIKDTPDGDNV